MLCGNRYQWPLQSRQPFAVAFSSGWFMKIWVLFVLLLSATSAMAAPPNNSDAGGLPQCELELDIATNDLKKIGRLRSGQDDFDPEPEQLATSLSDVDRVQAWIDEDDAVSRIAFEIMQESATLIGIQQGDAVEFPGVDDLFSCHTQRADFRVIIDIGAIDAEDRDAILGGDDYIDKYNDLLSRYWEFDIASC